MENLRKNKCFFKLGRNFYKSNILLKIMRVKVKFNTPMMKNGSVRAIGSELEIDATQAVLLQAKGAVEIPGYKVTKETREVQVNVLVAEDN